jgi:hypothetical protein
MTYFKQIQNRIIHEQILLGAICEFHKKTILDLKSSCYTDLDLVELQFQANKDEILEIVKSASNKDFSKLCRFGIQDSNPILNLENRILESKSNRIFIKQNFNCSKN